MSTSPAPAPVPVADTPPKPTPPHLPPHLPEIVRYGPTHPHLAGILRAVTQSIPPPEVLAGGEDAINAWLASPEISSRIVTWKINPPRTAGPQAPRAPSFPITWTQDGTEYGRANYSVSITKSGSEDLDVDEVAQALFDQGVDLDDEDAIRDAITEWAGEQDFDLTEDDMDYGRYEYDDHNSRETDTESAEFSVPRATLAAVIQALTRLAEENQDEDDD